MSNRTLSGFDSEQGDDDDQAFLDTVPLGALREFRDAVRASCCRQCEPYLTREQNFPSAFVKDNPQAFVGTSWVQIERLQATRLYEWSEPLSEKYAIQYSVVIAAYTRFYAS